MAVLSKDSSMSFFGFLIPNTPKKVMIIAAMIFLVGLLKLKLQGGSGGGGSKGKGKRDEKGKGNIDSVFFKRLMVLLKIVIPRWNCIEVREICSLNVLLVIRTMLSIYLAGINGKIVNAIVKLNFSLFVKRIISLGICAIPASFVNSYLDYLLKSIALNFRKRLTFYFHESYIKDMIFYQISNLDVRVANPDQRLTVDIEKWAFSMSSLYSNLSKPLLDIVLFSRRLANQIGWEGPGLVFALYIINIFILRTISPPFGKLTAIDQVLEGEYRGCHTDLIHHAEEIAFCRGDGWEKKRINASFEKLMEHQHLITNKRLFMGCFDALLSKYGAVLNGFWIVGLPVFGPRREEYMTRIKNDKTKITRDIVQNSSLLINLSKAIGRLIVSYKEMQHLAGYTTVVAEINDVIEDIKKGKFQKAAASERQEKSKAESLGRGEVLVGDSVKFEDVPIITPNSDVLIEKMSFELKPGMSCIITGPNGCGKSSLFRILGSLWPFSGKIHRPSTDKIFYVPQRAYLPNGTLRDQIIYPHNLKEMKEKRTSDTDLFKLLEAVNLAYLVQREGGFDALNDWYDVLSGGEKQRIIMARLFYHQPQFAILDDCTSAVSMDVEDKLYSQCKERGITMFTVSHRKTLFKFHEYRLNIDPEGNWSFEKLLTDATPTTKGK